MKLNNKSTALPEWLFEVDLILNFATVLIDSFYNNNVRNAAKFIVYKLESITLKLCFRLFICKKKNQSIESRVEFINLRMNIL